MISEYMRCKALDHGRKVLENATPVYISRRVDDETTGRILDALVDAGIEVYRARHSCGLAHDDDDVLVAVFDPIKSDDYLSADDRNFILMVPPDKLDETVKSAIESLIIERNNRAAAEHSLIALLLILSSSIRPLHIIRSPITNDGYSGAPNKRSLDITDKSSQYTVLDVKFGDTHFHSTFRAYGIPEDSMEPRTLQLKDIAGIEGFKGNAKEVAYKWCTIFRIIFGYDSILDLLISLAKIKEHNSSILSVFADVALSDDLRKAVDTLVFPSNTSNMTMDDLSALISEQNGNIGGKEPTEVFSQLKEMSDGMQDMLTLAFMSTLPETFL